MSLNFDTLKAVNGDVNEDVTFTHDSVQWGEIDRWEDGTETGLEDCDGYAIAKLRRLLAAGWPRSALKLGICTVETDERHLVLVATCDGEDYVLDNRYPFPMQWEDLPYRWEKFFLLGERRWRQAAT